MNKIFAGIVLLSVGIVTLWFLMEPSIFNEKPKSGEYPVHKHHKLRYKLTNTSGDLIKDVDFTTLVPYSLLANQKLVKVASDRAFTEATDSQGNRFYHYKISAIAPYQTIFIDLKVNVDMSLSAQAMNFQSVSEYLSASTYIESQSPEIKALAIQLKKATDLETLKSAYQWINRNLEYAGYLKQDLGALYALRQKKGDCTEYAYLMAALARASGIPARVIGGYVYPESSVIYAKDHHNWVEVWLDNKWQIIDPQKQRFMEKYSEYLSFRILNSGKNDFTNSHQISISDKRIEVVL